MYSTPGKRRSSGYPSSSSKRYKSEKKSYRKKTSFRSKLPMGEVLFVCLIIGLSTAILSSKVVQHVALLEQVVLNTSDSLNGCGTYIWSANNLYDPNYTGTGHQPPTMTRFRRYTTIGPSSPPRSPLPLFVLSNPVQLQAVLVCDDDATLGTSNNINLLIERSDSSTGACDPGNGLLMTLSQTFSAKKWFEPIFGKR